jgi:hypothetical protein
MELCRIVIYRVFSKNAVNCSVIAAIPDDVDALIVATIIYSPKWLNDLLLM